MRGGESGTGNVGGISTGGAGAAPPASGGASEELCPPTGSLRTRTIGSHYEGLPVI